jgi:transcription elongation factor GreA
MAKAKQMLYTKEGFEALVAELKERQTVKREEIKEAIATARSFGDLSENSEYDAARNEQAQNESRIMALSALIDNALIIDETKIDSSVVSIGSTVKVFDTDLDEELEYNIVGSNEVDPFAGKISDQSPIGHALMGKSAGAEVLVSTPAGTITMKVLEVSRK